jgi:hypothetical protein
MCKYRRFSVPLLLSLLFAAIGSQPARAHTPPRTINNPEGGVIVCGAVDGATSEAAAMSQVLRGVHRDCGDRPRVGRVFRVRGTNSVAVFFTVVNRAQGDTPVAGLLIAAPSGPNEFEAALVSDDAARFGSTVNPMLSRLFSEWHPGGPISGPSTPAGRSPVPASARAAGGGGALPPMRRVALRDNTATLNLPAGWSVDPKKSGGGGAMVHGPNGEQVALNYWFMAQDPRSPSFRQQQQRGMPPLPHQIIYPCDTDLTKTFPEVFQRLRASNGLGPAPIQIDHAEWVSGEQGQRCVSATGKVDPDGRGAVEINALLSASAPDQYGGYHFIISEFRIPLGSTDQQRATAAAIMASYQVNTELVQARSAAEMAPILAAMRQSWEAQTQASIARSQQISNGIRQIGTDATARMNSIQQANDAQHDGYWAQQDINARNGQGFNNYILDQTVIQDNNMYGNGTVGHGTVWNSTADALVKSDPNRWEIVDNPDFWQGKDY